MNIGLVYQQQGKNEEALDQYNRALDIRIRVLGHDHPDVAGLYNNISDVYHHKGKVKEELDHLHREIEIQMRVLGKDHPNVASTGDNIATISHYIHGAKKVRGDSRNI